MTDGPLVHADAVTKRFEAGATPAIDRLTISIAAGQVAGVVGPDGGGKTTLLRLLAGLLLPSEGTLRVCGFDPAAQLPEIRRSVSYMPQRFGLYEELSVQENLNLYADLRGVVGAARRQSFDRLQAFTGLGPFLGRLAGRLSGGMKQKLGLACALVGWPRLLLLDEPSVGVDPISRRELWHMVYQLAAEGIGVVWSTAYLDEAERCASVLLLHRGRVLYDGPPAELTARAVGRTFLAEGIERRRTFLAEIVREPDVIDAVVQGGGLRLVLRQGVSPAAILRLAAEAARVRPVPARFEDAFIELLGGGPKQESPLRQGRPLAGAEPAMVEARRLRKRFGDFAAADDISFRIARGEIYGLLGPNGAGKSTTFKMLCGLLRPTAGVALVAGMDLQRAAGVARARFGYMAQRFSLYGDLSVRQNLRFFAGVYGLGGAHRDDAIRRLAESLDLLPLLSVNARQLPLGFQQRLALACAVLHEPAVLFLDEPTSGVDPLTRREFWAHIHALVERGVTILVTTHFMDEAEYCDRIGLIFGGRLVAEGSPDELKERVRDEQTPAPTLEDAFVRLVEERHGVEPAPAG